MSRNYYISADNKNFFPELPIIYSGDWNNRTIWLLAIKVTVLTSAVPGLCRDKHGGLIFQICQACEAEQLQCSYYTGAGDSLFLSLTSTFQDFSYLNALHQWSYSIIKGKNFTWNMNAEWLCGRLFWKHKSPSKLESQGDEFLIFTEQPGVSMSYMTFLTVVYIWKFFWEKIIPA